MLPLRRTRPPSWHPPIFFPPRFHDPPSLTSTRCLPWLGWLGLGMRSEIGSGKNIRVSQSEVGWVMPSSSWEKNITMSPPKPVEHWSPRYCIHCRQTGPNLACQLTCPRFWWPFPHNSPLEFTAGSPPYLAVQSSCASIVNTNTPPVPKLLFQEESANRTATWLTDLTSLRQLQLAAVSIYVSDILTPICLVYWVWVSWLILITVLQLFCS